MKNLMISIEGIELYESLANTPDVAIEILERLLNDVGYSHRDKILNYLQNKLSKIGEKNEENAN